MICYTYVFLAQGPAYTKYATDKIHHYLICIKFDFTLIFLKIETIKNEQFYISDTGKCMVKAEVSSYDEDCSDDDNDRDYRAQSVVESDECSDSEDTDCMRKSRPIHC